jgi:hypothetical protein
MQEKALPSGCSSVPAWAPEQVLHFLPHDRFMLRDSSRSRGRGLVLGADPFPNRAQARRQSEFRRRRIELVGPAASGAAAGGGLPSAHANPSPAGSG